MDHHRPSSDDDAATDANKKDALPAMSRSAMADGDSHVEALILEEQTIAVVIVVAIAALPMVEDRQTYRCPSLAYRWTWYPRH